MADCDSNQAISKSINYFGINLFKELSKQAGNVFISPFSISSALAMAFVGASCETADEMNSTLGYKVGKLTCDNIKTNFQRLFSEIKQAPDVSTLNIANVVLGDSQLAVQEDFKQLLADFFGALFVDVDFVNGLTAAVEKTNDWVKIKTNSMVSHAIDSLDSDTKMIILNAVYFKGLWLHAFKEKSTFLQYFYNNGDEEELKLVDMMHLKEKFLYAEDVTFKALELPYKGGDLAMLFILPNSRNGLGELKHQMSAEFLKHVKSSMKQTEVEVALPKLNFEYSKSLKDHCRNLGMKRAFQAGAHFNKISNRENLFISDIIHKAVLEINEKGTEASAATAVLMSNYCITHCNEFIIDHPFLFLIYNRKSDLILFMGNVVEL